MITSDLIVIGLGGVGSAAAMHAAQHGLSVVGIEQFPLVHALGSSHGHTRAIRQAYFEHPNYVPLIRRAYELWDELAETTGREIFRRCGVLQTGPPDGEIITGVLQSAKQHNLQVDQLDHLQARERFAGFHFPESMAVLYEENAGFLFVERCVRAHLDNAVRWGAICHENETVRRWSSDGSSVVVETDREKYSAAKLVIAAGSWSAQLMQELKFDLKILRKHSYWYHSEVEVYGAGQGSPVFLFDTPEGIYYGFPVIDQRGLKIANHSGGELIDNPATVDRDDDPVERTGAEAFLATYLPHLAGRLVDHSVCMYTTSPDGHFIVDLHPEYSNVAMAAGLSGHGFKFVSALGEALVKILHEKSQLDLQFLQLGRLR